MAPRRHLGRRSLCWWWVAVGWVSSSPRQCWSARFPTGEHRGAGERTGPRTVLLGEFLFLVGRQTSRTSGRSLPVGRSDRSYVAPGYTRLPPTACERSQQWLSCWSCLGGVRDPRRARRECPERNFSHLSPAVSFCSARHRSPTLPNCDRRSPTHGI